MSELSKELVWLVLQFLNEEHYIDSVHRLERESGYFFNLSYFENLVINGIWDEVEVYLSGFTKLHDNKFSMKMFFEIRKQKYLEALDRNDRLKAVDILMKDLKVFSTSPNLAIFKEMCVLLSLENFRQHETLSMYIDTKSARANLLKELKTLIESNPLLREKLYFPSLENSRLRVMINQAVNFQHKLCSNPKPNPNIKTILVDHSCGHSQQTGAWTSPPIPNTLFGANVPNPRGFLPLGDHYAALVSIKPFQSAPSPLATSFAGWRANSQVLQPSVSAGPIGFTPIDRAVLKRPRTPTSDNADVHCQILSSEHVLKRAKPSGMSDEGNVTGPSHGQTSYSSNDLPKAVVRTLNQGSQVRSMDFHPLLESLLLVGTNTGEIMLWALYPQERLAHIIFKVWDLGACSATLQTSLPNDYSAAVNRVMWSPDGALFGVAYSKNIVHIYSYHGGHDLGNYLEIEAHAGSVNDLAFSFPDEQLLAITCGDDRLVKVWDASTGIQQFKFEGHEAPVYSLCPHFKEDRQYIFATSIDGKIKAWQYDNSGCVVDYNAPGYSTITLAYSSDGQRLFSCGSNKEGDSYLVEWDDHEGAVKRSYLGLGTRTTGTVQFDTTKNRFLAVGDGFSVKFWDMDNVNLLATVNAEGGLPASPCIRFNKEGKLLAVSTNENGIKILANTDGLALLRTVENRRFESSRAASAAIIKSPSNTTFGAGTLGSAFTNFIGSMASRGATSGDNQSLVDLKSRMADEPTDKSRVWKLMEINESSNCQSLRLPNILAPTRVIRLTYTNSGYAILALSANAVHNLWKWPKNERNPSGKANAAVLPQLWLPASGILMTNDISNADPANVVPCFALSNNDSYVMSASGGKISLFNMMTFKTMTTLLAPPPAATFLAFHPHDNNVIAIGMDDATIRIYNIRLDEVKSKLKGHQQRITGLSFSNTLNVLLSSGADSQLCVWSIDVWEKISSKYLHIPGPGVRADAPLADTSVQFHLDEKHVLVVHESHIAIYEAPQLDCLKQWAPREARGPITYATYSCDSLSIYASFKDGSLGVLTAETLQLRCLINPRAYLPGNPSSNDYPLVIAAHPTICNQFAVGLSNGFVHVLEPTESEAKWGTPPPLESGGGPSISAAASSSHLQR